MDVRNAIRQLEDKLERQRKAVKDTEEHIGALRAIDSSALGVGAKVLPGEAPARK